jgi:chromate transporter
VRVYGRGVSGPRPKSASLAEVFRAALALGLTSFGGPIAHIGYFRREYVERRRWFDDRAFADLVALCQSLPGPASSQLGIAIGARQAGILGGIVSWLGFTVPSAIVLVLFGLLSGSADLSGAGWIHGLKLAAVAVVAQAVYLLAGSLTPDWPRRAVALAGMAVALLWSTPFSQLAIIAGGAVVGWLMLRAPAAEAGTDTVAAPGPIGRRAGAVALGLFFVLLLGLPLLRAVTGLEGVAMVETFYRTGSLVFGGGHVVLPLLHAGVVDPGWVGEDRFLAGYGAAQAVPGPLFSFAAYLGAVSVPPLGGWSGGAIALVSIYLPSFLLIFGVLPYWDRLRESVAFRRALIGTNAAVVGLLAAALYRPIWTGAVESAADVVVVVAGLALLVTGRVPPIGVVALAAVAGQLIRG